VSYCRVALGVGTAAWVRPCRSGGQKIQDERRLHASMALVRPDSSLGSLCNCVRSDIYSFRWHWSSQDGDKLGPLLVNLSAGTVPCLYHMDEIKSIYTWTNSLSSGASSQFSTIQNPNVTSKSESGNIAWTLFQNKNLSHMAEWRTISQIDDAPYHYANTAQSTHAIQGPRIETHL
jgi:hypothetical protein